MVTVIGSAIRAGRINSIVPITIIGIVNITMINIFKIVKVLKREDVKKKFYIATKIISDKVNSLLRRVIVNIRIA